MSLPHCYLRVPKWARKRAYIHVMICSCCYLRVHIHGATFVCLKVTKKPSSCACLCHNLHIMLPSSAWMWMKMLESVHMSISWPTYDVAFVCLEKLQDVPTYLLCLHMLLPTYARKCLKYAYVPATVHTWCCLSSCSIMKKSKTLDILVIECCRYHKMITWDN